MKLTESDRHVLATLGSTPRDADWLVDALDESAEGDRPPDDLRERLAEFADNGLVRERDDGRYERTESGRRLLVTAGGRMDEAVDTGPDVEAAIEAADLAPDAADAVRGAYAFLRYWGEATVDEIVDAVYSEWPANFESAAAWWDAVGEALATLPDVAAPEANSADDSRLSTWRYTETPEVTTPESDGFLPSKRRGDHPYGSVKHAIEDLDLSDAERTAVRAAFGVLRRRGEASEDEIGDAAFAAHSAGHETTEAWWDDPVGEAFEALPGVERADGDRWRYTPGTTA